ncbi:unnamed protein product [marine sediment metagenome]|uniref:Major facilitator superfamily (MFS) profile domain-containing protein n=1 Tax=marine sediment metagenome TaxID=412755 RepID=X1CFT4_9ZZZZ
MSSLALVDQTGKYVAVLPAAQMLGFALGPLIVSTLITADNYMAVFITMIVFETIGLLLYIPITFTKKDH